MDSIGTLEIENIAYSKAWYFSWIFHVISLGCSVLQYVCFNLYNEKYHPMAIILEEYLDEGWLIGINSENNSFIIFMR